jgi:hypothetical protein
LYCWGKIMEYLSADFRLTFNIALILGTPPVNWWGGYVWCLNENRQHLANIRPIVEQGIVKMGGKCFFFSRYNLVLAIPFLPFFCIFFSSSTSSTLFSFISFFSFQINDSFCLFFWSVFSGGCFSPHPNYSFPFFYFFGVSALINRAWKKYLRW